MPTLFAVLYAAALGTDVAAIATGADDLRWFSKLALMPLLALYFLALSRGRRERLGLVLPALVAAWAADAALLRGDEISFLAGIALFGVMQVLYMWIFIGRGAVAGVREHWRLPLGLLVFWAAFNVYFWGAFGDFAAPVAIYSALLVGMAVLAAGLRDRWLTAGALAFVVSDLMIGLDLADIDFAGRSGAIMVTYAAAQVLIIGSLVRITRTDRDGSRLSPGTPLGVRP
ncbi:lysoplasmalogenase family protein [Salininema proteolyticum]|uniref:Lysoplasmalogenase family protein n=1 Tax=Salininema proteolyticum TaxID=1607685 RepID=A0ABV8TXG4_9ACTN